MHLCYKQTKIFAGLFSELYNTSTNAINEFNSSVMYDKLIIRNILNYVNSDIDKMQTMIGGLVGTGIAIEFKTWAKVYKDLPDIDGIFKGEMPEPPKSPDALYALTSAMFAYAKEHKHQLDLITNSIIYADKLPPDYSAMLLKDYM